MKKIRCIVLLIISIFVFSILFISEVFAYSYINEAEYANRLEVIEELFDEDSAEGTVQNNSKYVYITLDASKFHEAGCDYLDDRPVKVGLEWAQNNGYGPCKYCNPYNLYSKENTAIWNNNVFIIISVVIIFVLVILFLIKKFYDKK